MGPLLPSTLRNTIYHGNFHTYSGFRDNDDMDLEIPPAPATSEVMITAGELSIFDGNQENIIAYNAPHYFSGMDLCIIVSTINACMLHNQKWSQAMMDEYKLDSIPTSVRNIPNWFLMAMVWQGNGDKMNPYLAVQLNWLARRKYAGKGPDFWYLVYENWTKNTSGVLETLDVTGALGNLVDAQDKIMNPYQRMWPRSFAYPFALPFPNAKHSSPQRSAGIAFINSIFPTCSPFVDPFWPDSTRLAVDYYVPYLTKVDNEVPPGLPWPPPPFNHNKPKPPITGSTGTAPITGSTGSTGSPKPTTGGTGHFPPSPTGGGNDQTVKYVIISIFLILSFLFMSRMTK